MMEKVLTILIIIALAILGLLFATQADHVMDAVGRLTTDYLRDVRMEVEVQSVFGKPDETGFRSWLIEVLQSRIVN